MDKTNLFLDTIPGHSGLGSSEISPETVRVTDFKARELFPDAFRINENGFIVKWSEATKSWNTTSGYVDLYTGLFKKTLYAGDVDDGRRFPSFEEACRFYGVEINQ